jgi:hypothetical protein
VGEGGEEHRVQVSSTASILGWLVLGFALTAVSIWLFQVFAFLGIVVRLLAITALGTAFGKWRENRYLRGPKQ